MSVMPNMQERPEHDPNQAHKWVKLFNRLEAAVSHHRKGKLYGIDTSDEVDEALWKVRDKILKDAAS